MIRTLQIIYSRFHGSESTVNREIDCGQAIKFLVEEQRLNPTDGLYRNLIIEINSLRLKHLPTGFIERFCLARISEYILLKYPVNIAEAYLLSYVALNNLVDIHMMYFKLGTSGLIGPTRINGEMVTDTEAVAQFIIKSLTDAELIKVTDNRYIICGKNFSIEL